MYTVSLAPLHLYVQRISRSPDDTQVKHTGVNTADLTDLTPALGGGFKKQKHKKLQIEMMGTKEVKCNPDGPYFLNWGPLGSLSRNLSAAYSAPPFSASHHIKAAAGQNSSYSSSVLRKGRGNVAMLNLDLLESVSNLVLRVNQKKIALIER